MFFCNMSFLGGHCHLVVPPHKRRCLEPLKINSSCALPDAMDCQEEVNDVNTTVPVLLQITIILKNLIQQVNYLIYLPS